MTFFHNQSLLLAINDQDLQDELLQTSFRFMQQNGSEVEQILNKSWNENSVVMKNGASGPNFNSQHFNQLFSQYVQHKLQHNNNENNQSNI